MAAESEPARSFLVELRRRGPRVVGRLTIRETNGATMARRITGARCSDVASVLALATALAIDPRAELAPRTELSPRSPSDPPGKTERESRSELPLSPDVDDTDDDDADDEDTDDEDADDEDTDDAASRLSVDGTWTPRLALGARAAFGPTPQPSAGAAALIALRRRGALPFDELALELAHSYSISEPILSARAAFHFFLARPMLCAGGLDFHDLRIAPCLAFESGVVSAVGSEIPNPSRRTRFWAAGQGLLKLEIALSATWFLALEGGASLPFTRYRFVFRNPSTAIHDVPTVTGVSALRIGASL
ncbi:MAG TPA: hypothetical protein VKY73_11085, partial [Polyangiaceae bacterium]|nr:hypothetical protein [Polyangiaceae bacterium]